TNKLQGLLTLTADAPSAFRVHRDLFGDATANGSAARSLPPFRFGFVQDSETLLPLVRGPVRGGHANWEWVLEPGRVWDEPDNGGFSRAAIPFGLQERNANCTHVGVLTFAFKSTGETRDAAYQIASETCAYFKFDLAGTAHVAFAPATVPNAAD